LEDAVHARIAISALGRILFDEAVAAVDLHDLVDHAVEELRAPDLDHGALDGVLLDGLANLPGGFGAGLVDFGERRVHHADGAIHHGFAGPHADRHLGNFFADEA